MSEYKSEIGIAVAIGLVGAIALGVLATSSFPSHTEEASTTTMSSVAVPVSPPGSIILLAGELSVESVSCSLATGVCSLTIFNNSTTILQLQSCRMQVITGISVSTTTYTTTSQSFTTYTNLTKAVMSADSPTTTESSNPLTSTVTATLTATTVSLVNGTIGGSNVTNIPAESQVAATCAVSTTQIVHEIKGSPAYGNFVVRVDSVESYPSGAETALGFQGTWS